MLKKLRTKSGFTIVEVMVAFVIFAIMAGMVSVILNSTMQAKQNNTQLEEDIDAQKQAYYLKTQGIDNEAYNKAIADGNYSGVVSLGFEKQNGSSSSSVADVDINYVAVDPHVPASGEAADSVELEYYVAKGGNDKWMSEQNNSTAQVNENGEIMGNLNASIYGSNGIGSVTIGIEPRLHNGDTIYLVYMSASQKSDYFAVNKPFAQLRVKFPSKIVSYGCINNTGNGDIIDSAANTSRSYVDVNVPGDKSTIRVSGNGDTKTLFNLTSEGNAAAFWVKLETPLTDEEISDPTKIFGNSGTTDVTTGYNGDINLVTFYPYTVDDDPATTDVNECMTYVNVFAAKDDPVADPTPPAGSDEATNES